MGCLDRGGHDAREACPWELDLLRHWQLRSAGELVEVPPRQQRMLAALALLGTRLRGVLAEPLWPTSSETKATGNLRTGMWRITHDLPRVLSISHDSLALSPRVIVDWRSNQRRLSALEALAENFLAAGDGRRCADAAAASIEPLRENPFIGSVRGHISTGNYCPAVKAFEDFGALLTDELGIEPSPRLQHLISETSVER